MPLGPIEPFQNLTDALIANADAQPRIIDPTWALYKFAHTPPLNLGVPHTGEFDVPFNGETYRCQVYDTAIVYAKVGDWGNVQSISHMANS